MRFVFALAVLSALATTATPAAPGMQQMQQHAPATAFGNPGNAKDVTRVIDLSLRDTMTIVPDRLRIRQGQTVRLRITNAGKMPHELVLGTHQEILEHWNMMRTMPTMQHAEANAVQVAPGATAEIIWRFSKPGSFLYACLIPLHWEAGMQGTITVSPAPKP